MKNFKFALKCSFPIFFAYVFLGTAFGMMMRSAGYSLWTAAASSLFIYAGSMQIVMVPLLQAGAALPLLFIMTLFVNGRHIFYGMGFVEKFRRSGWRYPYMVFALTDETYSILCSVQYPEDVDERQADLLIALLNQSYWVLGTIVGSVAGSVLPWDLTGIEFSATAFFLIVVLDQLAQYPTKLPMLTGLISAAVCYLLLGPEYFLIPALSVSMIMLVFLRDRLAGKLEVKNV